MNENELKNEEGNEFLEFFSRKGKRIGIVVLVALIAATALTFILPKEYRSQGIVFPANNNSVESIVDNPTVGYDLEADRLMQLLQSDAMFDSVQRHFHLADYFELDTAEPDWRDVLHLDYLKIVKFERTQYMSIVISAQTKKPELSAAIVNFIIDISDGMRNNLYKRNQLAAYRSVEKNTSRKKTSSIPSKSWWRTSGQSSRSTLW
ncbi:MAG TPA: hypothetical protein VFU15_08495 [Bacteroidia bacterium]|nr:hypothetical protein [Bacteroidia bacterium]